MPARVRCSMASGCDSLSLGRVRVTGKFLLAVVVSAIPCSRVRAALYGLFFGYSVSQEAILGPFAIIAVDQARIGSVRIRGMCIFRGPYRLEIGDRTVIGSWNSFECGEWAAEATYADAGYARECRIGADCLVTAGHFIDTTGGFAIGDRTWIAGRGSQFWTHGAGADDRSVAIGDDCYVGSRVIFAPGSAMGDGCLAMPGCVVTRRLEARNALVGGVPASVVRVNWDWRNRRAAAD